MHCTLSIGSALVLEGEINMLLYDSETNAETGDIVVNRGANRSGRASKMLLTFGCVDVLVGVGAKWILY